MKGYKGMNEDMTCRGMKFEVGKTYHVGGEIRLCNNGLHFCKNLRDVFHFYSKENSRFFEIEAKAPILSDGSKSVTAELTVVKELSSVEINRCFYGDGDGYGYGYGDVNGYGYGSGSGDGYGDGDGYGYGYGDVNGYGSGSGSGYGSGYGYGYGSGDGSGDGYGYGYGNGCGNTSKNIQKCLMFN